MSRASLLSTRAGRLAALCLACMLAIGAAVVVSAWTAEGDSSDADSTEDASVAATEPGPAVDFGPVPAAGAGAVRTDSGLVLPVVAGADDDEAPEVRTPCARTAIVEGERIAGAHVVIDPGHGGFETGAVGPNGIVEKELNLDVALRVADQLEALGATVVLTRIDDTRVTLRTRAELAQALQPKLFISIHHNGGPTVPADRPGTQVYHQADVAEAERFAGLVFDAIGREMTPLSPTWSAGNAVGVRPRLDDEGDDFYGVLRLPDVPSVLIEALFISAEPDAVLMTRDDVREAEARAITTAVVDWLEGATPTDNRLPPLVAAESPGGGGGADDCVDPAGL